MLSNVEIIEKYKRTHKTIIKNAIKKGDKIYYHVDISQKEEFKKIGGEWDNNKLKWYLSTINKTYRDIRNIKSYHIDYYEMDYRNNN